MASPNPALTELEQLLRGSSSATAELKKAFIELTQPIDAISAGIQKSLRDMDAQSRIQKQINAISGFQASIQNVIAEKKKALLVYDQASFEIENLKIQNQKAILQYQIMALENAMNLGLLSSKQNKIAKEKIDDLTIESTMLSGIQNLYKDQLDAGKSIDDRYKDVLTKVQQQIDALNAALGKDKTKIEYLEVINKLIGFQIQDLKTMKFYVNAILTAFASIEDAAFEVRKSLGLIGKEGDKFKTLITDTYVRFANLGVTAEIVGKTITSISNTFGSSVLASEKLVESFSILETSLGITSETSAKVSRMFAGISKSSTQSQTSMIGFAKSLSNAAGVPLAKVMEDLSSLTESVRLTFRGTTTELVKSTVEARRLGLTINDVANVAEKLLNFQDSINAEIEASVMMGKNISFNDARVLAYRGDILGATKSILDTVEKTVDLNNVDYFTLKAIAESTGLNVSQLQDSLQVRKDIQTVSRLGTDEARKQYDLYKSLNKSSESAAKNAGEEALERLKNTNNLALQKQFQTELNGLILQLGQALLPILQGLSTVFGWFTALNNKVRELTNDTTAKWVSSIILVGTSVLLVKGKFGELFSFLFNKIPGVSKLMNLLGLGSTASAAGAAKTFGKGSMFAGIGNFMSSLGNATTILAAAGSLFILAEALKAFPTDLGGLSIGEYMRDVAGGILYLSLAMGLAGLGIEFMALGAVSMVLLGLSLQFLGKSLQTIVDPIKTFSDSFSKLVDTINTDNITKMKDGVVAVKEAMTELRGELQKFSKDDLGVLEKLGNLKANISAGIEGGEVKSKESANTAMAETIKSAVVEGMRQVKISISLDGKAVGTGIASTLAFSQPASTYMIGTKQGEFV